VTRLTLQITISLYLIPTKYFSSMNFKTYDFVSSNCDGNGKGTHFFITARLLVAISLAFLPVCKCEPSNASPSATIPFPSIPTHHGINASLHLKGGGGGAVATKGPWKKRLSYRVSGYRRNAASTNAHTEVDEAGVRSNLSYPSVYTSYSIKPNANELNTLESVPKTSELSSSINPINPVQTQPLSQRTKASSQSEGLSPTAVVCMSLLALQFGIQPILVRKYTPQTIVRSSVVLVQELVKFGIAGAIYFSGTGRTKNAREKDFYGWSIRSSIAVAGLPAFLYTIQNVASLMAYQNLEALTFNVLNQTKILSAALSCYFVMGKQQSRMQILSLFLLVVSTLVIEKIIHPSAFVSLLATRGGSERSGVLGLQNAFRGFTGIVSSFGDSHSMAGRRFTHGIIPILVASLISGLAGALTQLNLQGGSSNGPIWGRNKATVKSESSSTSRPPRNAYLFSMEMNVASVILLLSSLLFSSDGRHMLKSGSFFSEWTPQTFIPVITNAIGGILVGLVTKHAGSVRKGFSLIFGLLLSGMFQANGGGIRSEQVLGGILAGLSLWMHTVHPHVPKKKIE